MNYHKILFINILVALLVIVAEAYNKNNETSSKEVKNTKIGGEKRSKVEDQRISTPYWIPNNWSVNLPERQQFVENIKLINDSNLLTNNEAIRGWENTNRVDGNDNEYDEYDYGDYEDNNDDDKNNYDGVFSSYEPSRDITYQRRVRSYPISLTARHMGDRTNGYRNLNRIESQRDFNNENDDDYQSDQPIGTLTSYKEQNLGNPASVQSNFEYLKELEEQRKMKQLRAEANRYREEVYAKASCKVPRRQLIYPMDITKKYDPPAAILHRCDNSTGCCRDHELRCEATKQNTVYLAFWEKNNSENVAKLMAFINHTECACVSRSQRNKRSSSPCQCPEYFNNFGTQRDQYSNADRIDNDADPYSENYEDEIFPSIPTSSSSSSCRCDCHLNNAICQRLKNGEEGFSMSERKCISSNKCSQPICNYGLYNRYKGRCPSPDTIRQNGGQQQQQQQQQQRGHRGHG